MKPIEYDLFLHPDLQNGTYSGHENITLEIVSETNEIVLHSHLLNITQVKLFADKEIPVSELHHILTCSTCVVIKTCFRFIFTVQIQLGHRKTFPQSEFE